MLAKTTVMGIENFIADALHKPNDFVGYHVGRRLAELHPGKGIIAGENSFFDLEAFVRAEKCSIVSESSVFQQIKTDWSGPRKEPSRFIQNSWVNVFWKGQLLDVVLVTYNEDCYPTRHHWIVAGTKEVAESFFSEVCQWSSEVRGELLVFQDGRWMKNKELYNSLKATTFESLILRDNLKQQIQNDFAQFLASRQVYERYGIPWKRGVLFVGPPGNGKTHTVKALINHLQLPCLYVKGFKSDHATDQENIRSVFKRARMTTPCIVVMEDLDSMIDDKSRAFFLNELDGFETNSGVLVLATTNHVDRLDPAIVNRPSRFDRKYYFDPPGMIERAAYVDSWNQKLESSLRLSETTGGKVVLDTDGFSFAYLKELFLSSMMTWVGRAAETSMDQIILEQIASLRDQMNAAATTVADTV